MSKKHLIVMVLGLPLLAQVAGAAAVTGVTAASLFFFRKPAPPPPPAPAGPLAGHVVAIDPGHGGFDGGVAYGGIVEKDLNLDIARRLRARIEERDGTVVMTRTADVAYEVDNRADLNHRLKLAEEGGAEILVSLHANSFPDPGQFGAQTFFPPKAPESQRLALLIQEELVRLQPENYREALSADYYILLNSRRPAALVEVGFITNGADRARLLDPAAKDRLAAAIADAIQRYFSGEEPRPHVPSTAFEGANGGTGQVAVPMPGH